MTPQVQLLGFECIQDSLIRDNKGFESLKKQENPIGHLPGLVRDQKNSFSNRLFFSLARFNRFEAVYLAHLMKNSEGSLCLPFDTFPFPVKGTFVNESISKTARSESFDEVQTIIACCCWSVSRYNCICSFRFSFLEIVCFCGTVSGTNLCNLFFLGQSMIYSILPRRSNKQIPYVKTFSAHVSTNSDIVPIT
ncbi:unnamed protein product [Albugo candida]|uniref:Uncharacterized protein n=1 Tax=Albugo candida TaxID=65357 RepID=A0A024FT47_9STRA|nr:unnamed protein product [Albugo candida]|eukprot:CCI10265.1 unnamed protein product [Albugo candida]